MILLQLLLSLLLPQFCAVSTAFFLHYVMLLFFSSIISFFHFPYFCIAFKHSIYIGCMAFVVIAVVVMTFNTFKRF